MSAEEIGGLNKMPQTVETSRDFALESAISALSSRYGLSSPKLRELFDTTCYRADIRSYKDAMKEVLNGKFGKSESDRALRFKYSKALTAMEKYQKRSIAAE